MNFDNIRVVLVATTHPGNIGAAARAMKTMGLTRLVLVKPALFPNAEATALASGADDVLYRARVVDNLAEALHGCRLVLGASARRRGISAPELDARAAACAAAAHSAQGEVALVFGRESSGLTNDELDHCHYRIFIPCNPEFSSLNLAAAVQVLGYELRMAAHQPAPAPALQPAPAEAMGFFYDHLQTMLLQIGFLDARNPRHLMRRLRQLFNRAQPDAREVRILRGILSAVQQALATARTPS